MNRFVAFALSIAAVIGSGCKKKSDDAGGAAAGGTAVPPGTATASGSGPRPEPFTGKLTIDRLLGARDLVKPFDPWDDGFARLQALLGEPTKIDGTRHTWSVVNGDDCAYVYVTRDNGADYKVEGTIVGTVQAPTRTSKGGTSGDHSACLAAAGVAVGPPEDPTVPGPPTDGSIVPLADARNAIIPARSKWKDQRVKIAAVLGGVSTTKSGDDTFVTANLTGGSNDKDEPLTCAFAKNQAIDAKLAQGTAVIAEGTVRIQEWTSMGSGDLTLRPSLADCALAAAPAPKGQK